ncbi:DUF2232 domain-containing protein, partial [Desulfobulbus sp. F4]|nr:DUF2232 domain-containing protein [Desulfobulbus sp. F4]
WLDILLAVPIFLLLQTAADERTAIVQLRNGLLIAAGGAVLAGEPALFIFSLTMLPVGWSLHRSAGKGLSPSAAGGRALAMLSLTWLVFWQAQAGLTGSSPYTSLLTLLDVSLERLHEEARTSAEVSAEVGHQIAMTVTDIRSSGLVKKLVPALLVGSAVLTVWLNLVISSGLLRRLRPDRAVWLEYRFWRLPESLVWLLIVAVVLLLLGGSVTQQAGYALAAVAGLVYFFQGTAIFAHLLHRWQVPTFWRAVLYFFVAAQGYGMLLLTVIGVADTWADFRKLTQDRQPAGRS